MIKPQLSYAQYGEDITLLALLSDVKKGFYIDVGANQPTLHSVTKLFYDEGWSGINIEPNKALIETFSKERPRDINLAIAIGAKKNTMKLRIYHTLDGSDGISTLSQSMKSEYEKDDKNVNTANYSDVNVAVERLGDIADKHAKNKIIDFLKVDVEGFESEVVKGIDWEKCQPKVICIESNHGDTTEDWEKNIINEGGYRRFITDGLNDYYVHKEHWELTEGFAERASIMRLNIYPSLQFDVYSNEIKIIEDAALTSAKLAERAYDKLQDRFKKVDSLSLYKKPLRKRIAIAFNGIFVDWLRSKTKI